MEYYEDNILLYVLNNNITDFKIVRRNKPPKTLVGGF